MSPNEQPRFSNDATLRRRLSALQTGASWFANVVAMRCLAIALHRYHRCHCCASWTLWLVANEPLSTAARPGRRLARHPTATGEFAKIASQPSTAPMTACQIYPARLKRISLSLFMFSQARSGSILPVTKSPICWVMIWNSLGPSAN